VAKYNKKRARELQHDKFRDTTMGLFEQIGNRLEGKGRLILYGLGAVIALGILFGVFSWWRTGKTNEARQALGRAIEIATAPVSPSPQPGSTTPSFTSEKERAQKAVEEFQKVAQKYGDPYREKARYFMAAHQLVLDRNKAISELEGLSKSGDAEVATLSKFALAQAKEADGQYDAAIALYTDLTKENSPVINADTANLRLAAIYEKQGKKKEAADVLFNIIDTARKAKDQEGKPIQKSAAAREAEQMLERLDSARYAQLPPEPPPDLPL
jgi:hypothetical protein